MWINEPLPATSSNVGECQWQDDPVLSQYDMKIQPTMIKVKAHVLPSLE